MLAFLTAIVLLLTGADLAQAAPPYSTNGTIHSVKFTKTEVKAGSFAQLEATWSFPGSVELPAGFTIDLPSELEGRGDTFTIRARDTGAVMASCVATTAQLQCDMDADYVTANPRGLNGDVYFWVRVNETVDESTEIEYTFGSVTTEVTVTPPGGPCLDDCEFEWGYHKDGSINYADNVITWWVQVRAEDGGMRGGEVVKVLDIPDQNQELILTENTPRLQETNEVGP